MPRDHNSIRDFKLETAREDAEYLANRDNIDYAVVELACGGFEARDRAWATCQPGTFSPAFRGIRIVEWFPAGGNAVLGCPKCGHEWPKEDGPPCPKCGH